MCASAHRYGSSARETDAMHRAAQSKQRHNKAGASVSGTHTKAKKTTTGGTEQVHASSYHEPAATPITYRGVPADRAVMRVKGTAIVNISNAALLRAKQEAAQQDRSKCQ